MTKSTRDELVFLLALWIFVLGFIAIDTIHAQVVDKVEEFDRAADMVLYDYEAQESLEKIAEDYPYTVDIFESPEGNGCIITYKHELGFEKIYFGQGLDREQSVSVRDSVDVASTSDYIAPNSY